MLDPRLRKRVDHPRAVGCLVRTGACTGGVSDFLCSLTSRSSWNSKTSSFSLMDFINSLIFSFYFMIRFAKAEEKSSFFSLELPSSSKVVYLEVSLSIPTSFCPPWP
jgi:hypothetical protein